MKQYVSKFSGKELDERLTRVDDIPTKTSELNNDSGFISKTEADNKYTDKNKTDVLEGDIKTLKDKVDSLENSSLGKEIFEIEVVDGTTSSLHLPKRNTVAYNLYEDTKEYFYINTPTVIEEESTDSNFYWKLTWDGEGYLKIEEKFQEVLLPDHFEIYQYVEDIDEILIPISIPRKKDFKTINGQHILGSGNIDVKVPTKVSQLENDKNYIDEETFTTTLENDYVIKDDVYAVADGLRDSNDIIFYLPTNAPEDTDRMLLTNSSLKTINGESILGEGNLVIEGGSGGFTWTDVQ